jgi:hypothetical protein
MFRLCSIGADGLREDKPATEVHHEVPFLKADAAPGTTRRSPRPRG